MKKIRIIAMTMAITILLSGCGWSDKSVLLAHEHGL